jgi:hypothetical protein
MPTAKESGKTFTPVPAGTHIGRAIQCISLGTQTDPRGQFLPSFKVMLAWEIPDEIVIRSDTKEEKPMVISKEYTLSLGKKSNLRRDLEGWRGREFTKDELAGFAVEKVLDAPCMLNVIHKTSASGNTYAVITGISPLPKGVTCKPRVHDLLQYEIESGTSCPEWMKIPEFIRKKIEACEEWTKPNVGEPAPVSTQAQPEGDPDVPF